MTSTDPSIIRHLCFKEKRTTSIRMCHLMSEKNALRPCCHSSRHMTIRLRQPTRHFADLTFLTPDSHIRDMTRFPILAPNFYCSKLLFFS